MKKERANKIVRSPLWKEIYNITLQIPRKKAPQDSLDAGSAATAIERLIIKKLSI